MPECKLNMGKVARVYGSHLISTKRLYKRIVTERFATNGDLAKKAFKIVAELAHYYIE